MEEGVQKSRSEPRGKHSNFLDITRSDIFTDIFHPIRKTKEKIKDWDYIKLKKLFAQQRNSSTK